MVAAVVPEKAEGRKEVPGAGTKTFPALRVVGEPRTRFRLYRRRDWPFVIVTAIFLTVVSVLIWLAG